MRITRRFNYTHRVKIPISKIHLDVERSADGGCEAVVRRIDLEERGSHEENDWNIAKVIVEARRLSTGSYCRAIVGPVAEVRAATAPFRFELSNFGEDSEITFRVKVVDASKRLLAEADGVRAGEKQATDRDPLIYLVPADLKEEVWKVDVNELDGARVLVNRRMPNWSGLLTRDAFIRALLLPQIVRQALQAALASESADEWVENWLRFAERLGHDDPPEDGAEVGEWVDKVDKVVQAFCDSAAFATNAEHQLRILESQ